MKLLTDSYLSILDRSPSHVSTISGLVANLHSELSDLKVYLDLPGEANDEALVEKLQAVKAEVKKDYGCTFQHVCALFEETER